MDFIVTSSLAWVLSVCLLGSLISVGAAGVYLLLPQLLRDKTLDYLICFAIGMLLGASFLHLLPEAIEQAGDSVHGIMRAAVSAILAFFILEKGLIWRHHHHHESHQEIRQVDGMQSGKHAGPLILIGDSVHNFLDGILIASAFLADFSLGVVTALAVIAHEIPQELGDFAILIKSGYTRSRALIYNLLTSIAMIIGATLAWFWLSEFSSLIPYLLTFTAASFIYVAVSDLMPTLNSKVGLSATTIQIILIALGLALNGLVHIG
jgi:zinc and cadmium transporter